LRPWLRFFAMPGYLTKQEPVAVSGVADLLIRSLLDRQQFHDPEGLAERLGISSAAWPIFGLTWPSGAQLAARMAMRPINHADRILEIGCGLALPSLVGHRRGADVTASDCHPLAEAFLNENLRLNHLSPLPYRHGQWGRSGDAGEAGQAARVEGRFHLIMGSDVLYERNAAGDLASFIEVHAHPQAEIWIMDPDRSNRATFNRHMSSQGFELTQARMDQPARGAVPAYKGRLLSYQRHTLQRGTT
jgi:predicted nicotinamide N-methyase